MTDFPEGIIMDALPDNWINRPTPSGPWSRRCAVSPCMGRECTILETVTLGALFGNPKALLDHVGTVKGLDTAYFCMGFNSKADGPYERSYGPLDKIEVVAIDCDNPQGDRTALDAFRREFASYHYILWETPSSTPERPRFRALLPLDRPLDFSREAMEAIREKFDKWTDEAAVWFDLPIKDKLHTLEVNEGRFTSSWDLMRRAYYLKRKGEVFSEADAERREHKRQEHERLGVRESYGRDGWRKLKKVQAVLASGVNVGERHRVLVSCIGCIKAATSNGQPTYGPAEISAFLDEVFVPDSRGESGEKIKAEFRRRFCAGLD